MKTVPWQRGMSLPQDPNAERDYLIDFTDYLEGETIVSVELITLRCTAAQKELTDTAIKVRLSAIDPVRDSSLTMRVTSNSGQLDDRTIIFKPASF